MESELYDIQDIISVYDINKHKGIIGKECFFATSVEKVIDYANYGYGCNLLAKIDYHNNTFLAFNGKSYKYAILKKKKNIIFRPFRSAEEFIKEVQKRSRLFNGLDGNMLPAIWVKNIKTDFITSIISINTDTDLLGEVHLTNHYIITFSELLNDYIFFDGTPCGMLGKEDFECPAEYF